MEVIVRHDAAAAANLTAALVAARIRTKPALVLGLATGRTMEAVYNVLVTMQQTETLDFASCTTFNLDEYIGVSPEDEHSYRFYMNQLLFNRVNIELKNTHIPHGLATNLRAEAARYEALITHAGGIDLQLLGIGNAGHIGFNEPLSALMSRTRDKALTPTTRQQNAGMFNGDVDAVPKRALTMGVGTILEARELILLATGDAKASIIAKAIEGPITSMISASAIQLHPSCKVVLDEPAAAQLTHRDYYDWVFENEPEWDPYR